MAKRKSLVMSVVIGLCVVALVVMLTGCNIPFFSDIFGDISVTIEDKEYKENVTGMSLKSGAIFTVNNVEDYDVTMFAKKNDNDFNLSAGEFTSRWSDAAGTDFTNGFRLKKDGSRFTVTYSGLAGVIAGVLAYDITDIVFSDIPADDLFDMRIKSDKKEISISFNLADMDVNVDSIDFDKNDVIFGRRTK